MTKHSSLIFVILFLIILTGCRTTKAPLKSDEMWVPSEGEEASVASDTVWPAIKKQEIDTSHPLTLDELIDISLSNNPSTRQAWENARLAEAGMNQAKSQLYPQIDISADATRQKKVGKNKQNEIDELVYGPSSDLSYLLFDFGGRRADIEEAFQNLLSANFQFNQTLQDIILDTETAYYELYSSQSGLDAAESDLKNAEATYEAAQRKVEAGLASRLDVLQAKSDYENAIYSLEQAKETLENAKANLAQTLGFSADTEVAIAEPIKEIPLDITTEDLNKLIEEALKRKPEIASLRASIKAKEAVVKSANSDLWPTLNLAGTAEKNWVRQYGDVRTHDHNYGYTGALSAKWNIFDGFYNINKKRAAQADLKAEKEKLKQTELEASTDVWNKYFAYKAAVKKFASSKVFFDTALTSYELASESYNVGLKSILDVLQSQSDLSDSRSKLIQSRRDLYVSIADLAHSLGVLGLKNRNMAKK